IPFPVIFQGVKRLEEERHSDLSLNMPSLVAYYPTADNFRLYVLALPPHVHLRPFQSLLEIGSYHIRPQIHAFSAESSTLGTPQQRYHHHQCLPCPLQTTPDGLVENYLQLITEKVSRHDPAQRGFSRLSLHRLHSPAFSCWFRFLS